MGRIQRDSEQLLRRAGRPQQRARLISLGVLASLASGCALLAKSPPPIVSDGRYAMGTVLELTVVTPELVRGRRWLEESFRLVEKFEAQLSRHDPRSALSLLNASAGSGVQVVAPDLAEILQLSLDYSRLTAGSFDVTVGPLVELWIDAARRDRIPSAEEISRARGLVGSQQLRVVLARDGEPASVELPKSGMSVDLGAIAKGYALDRLRPRLAAEGFDTALLSFGQSSVWALGAPPGSRGWNLLLRSPDGFSGVVTLRDQAFSVSSTVGQLSTIAGREFGHVIDPRSGWALTRTLQAAVVAPTASIAEALSTALVILDEREAIALVESQPETEALLIDATGRRVETSGWRRATRFEDFSEGDSKLRNFGLEGELRTTSSDSKEHVERFFQESLEGGQPLRARGAVESSVIGG